MHSNKRKKLKNKSKSFLFLLIIVAIVLAPLLIFGSSITGFIAVDSKTQILNMTFTESQALNIKSQNNEQVHLSSLSISGEVIGNGKVIVYIANGDKRALVYTNVNKKKTVPPITGAFSGTAITYKINNRNLGRNTSDLIFELGRKLDWQINPTSFDESSKNSANGSFTSICINSCYLNPADFTASNFELQIFVEPGTLFNLKEITYILG
jgi:hypothetical protein